MKPSNGASANVTSLIPYLTRSADPALTEMLDYWESLRAGRIAPLRCEIDPHEIEGLLEHAFILERVGRQMPRFRIAGMNLCDLMGMEIRTMPATALISPPHRAQFARLLHGLFDRPEILEVTLASGGPHSPRLSGEMLLLPIQATPGEITRLLGCLVTTGSVNRTPVRFDIKSSKHTRITATRMTESPPLAAGFAESAVPFRAQKSGRRPPVYRPAAGPHLRLVKTDE